MNEMATELGLIHDIDLGLQRMKKEFPECPSVLRAALAGQRRAAVLRFRSVRKKCRKQAWYRSLAR